MKDGGKYKNLLIFKRLTDGILYPRYVKEGENVDEIIKKCTSDIFHNGIHLGKLLELAYNHEYTQKLPNVTKIPFEKINNLFFIQCDANKINDIFFENSFSKIFLNFSDP